eukprot:SAG31_NODE_652_length_13181_cov_14.268155_7_plen_478_part_00
MLLPAFTSLVAGALLLSQVVAAGGGQQQQQQQPQQQPPSLVHDIFQGGEEGYICYRIPVLFRLPNGDIALYAEGRKDNCDDIDNTDIVFKISKDNGRSFGSLHRLYGESTSTSKVTIGNPAPVIVGNTVLLLCVRNAQRLLRLRSADAGGMVWPTRADDITDATFAHLNTHMECQPGALKVGGDLRTANMTIAEAKQWCLGNVSCGGFTGRSNQSAACLQPESSPLVYQFYFKSRAGGNTDRSWVSWTKPNPPGTMLATGPPGGMVLPSGRIVSEFYRMGGANGSSAAALLSDDHGRTFSPSANSVLGGGEGTIATAPNGSLILNTRASNNLRLQAESRDGGEHWSSPARRLLGFGSNAEGAMIRLNGTDHSGLMLLSHAGDVNGTAGRWNMTIWSSNDSAATWTPAVQVEPDPDIALHQAYSTMLQLSPTEVLIVWERGPIGGHCAGYPHCFPPAGEYQTLRARVVSLPGTPSRQV